LLVLEKAFAEVKFFTDSKDDLVRWIDTNILLLKENPLEHTTGTRIRELLDEHRAFQEDLSHRSGSFDSTYKKGEALEEHAPPEVTLFYLYLSAFLFCEIDSRKRNILLINFKHSARSGAI
jgi:hypothetical protein